MRAKRSWFGRAWDRVRKSLGRRGYDAADTGRRSSGWGRPATSANAEIDRALALVRGSARELVRNDAMAASAVSVIVNNTVGEGIQPRAAFPKGVGDQMLPASRLDPAETVNQRCDRIWSEVLETIDASGQLNAYGQQILACRGIVESGEALLQRHWRRFPADGLSVPMQVELLEGDLLDQSMTKTLEDGRIVQGVEFDGRGRRVRYWLHPEHPGALVPGSSWTSWGQSSPVPASEISHAYEPLRPGQVRGMSFLTPVISDLQGFSDYTTTELERKRLEACIFASVDGLGGDEYVTGSEAGALPALTTDSDGVIQEDLQPGAILYPPEGSAIHVHTPGSVGGVAEFRRQQLTSIAAGMRLCYTLLTGDLSGTNYSSIRAGLIEFRRFIRSFRQQVFIRLVCRPQWEWAMEAAQVIGRIPMTDSRGMPIRTFPARWAPPMFESVDRLKDAQADNWELANATTDIGQIILGRGRVPEEVFRDQSKAIEMLDELKIPAAWRVFRPWNVVANEQRDEEPEAAPAAPPPFVDDDDDEDPDESQSENDE